jgi:tRNA threonylcarbamoyladenosine biosynthesis protein TsaB
VHVLILSLDTSSPAGSIAISRDHRLLAVVSTTTEETFSSRIFRQLDFLLRELDLTFDRFDAFGVNVGPGSFTGLRVGLTTAKAWAEAYAKPLVPVSALEAVAMQVGGRVEHVIPVLDARRAEMYAGVYRRANDEKSGAATLNRVGEELVMKPEEFLALLSENPEFARASLATTSPAWLASLLSAQGEQPLSFNINEVSPVLAPAIGRIAFERMQRGETVDALRLDANYVRRCDAEVNWKGK